MKVGWRKSKMLENQLASLGIVSFLELQNQVLNPTWQTAFCSMFNPALDGAGLDAAEVQTGCIMLHIRRPGSCQLSITFFILK